MYVTTRLVILYTTTAGISLGSEKFLHESLVAACNATSWSVHAQTGFVVFFGKREFGRREFERKIFPTSKKSRFTFFTRNEPGHKARKLIRF